MNTFTANIIYRIELEGQSTDQYEEQVRLVFADTIENALAEARSIGQVEEAIFVDRHGRSVCWRMLAVKDIQPVELKNGGLLFSKVHEPEIVAAPVWVA